MGAGLVLAAYEVASRLRLDHAPARMLAFMAAKALDADERPTFYAGRDALAHSLGAEPTNAGYRSVERAMSALMSAGAVSVVSKGAPGRNSRYALLDGAGGPLAVNPPRSASCEELPTPHADRRVNNSEHPTVSDRTPHGQRPSTPRSAWARGVQEKEEELPAGVHPHEQNARKALVTLQADNHIVLDLESLLAHAYRIGGGDPWRGYLALKPIASASYAWADNPAAALDAKLTKVTA